MAFPPIPTLLVLATVFLPTPALTQKPIRALVLPVTKDPKTLQYTAIIQQRTPSVPVSVVVHLGGRYLSVDCDKSYVSSTYRPVRCGTAQCAAAKSTSCVFCSAESRPGCSNNTCGLLLSNPFARLGSPGVAAEDAVSVRSTDGSNPGRLASNSRFLFYCGSSLHLDGLAAGAKGIIGLGRTQIAPPSQFAEKFSFHRKFAICLSASANGVIFFGNGPYRFLPNKLDVSESLLYTPLLTNPRSTALVSTLGEPSYEYFIGVKAIEVNGKPVSLNDTLLTINRESGVGGTKISTVQPYTVLETSIHDSVAAAFARESGGLTEVPPVAPFKHCFDARNVSGTRVGPAVPSIDLMLQSKRVFWRMFGANSMVTVKPGVLCLGFVDGGRRPRTSIVIGGHQLEDNLLQFDLAASRMGFSSSLLFRRTTCANFNSTTVS